VYCNEESDIDSFLSCFLFAFCSCKGTDGTSSDISSQTDPSSSEVSSGDASSKEENSSEKVSSFVDEQPGDWRKHPQDFKLIALTYDDAPYFSTASDNATVRIIDAISQFEGRGTIFVVGSTLQKNGEALLKYAVDNGFQLGNHTQTHTSVLNHAEGKLWTAEQNKNDFLLCQNLVKEKTGETMKYLRPAGLHTNDALFTAAAEMGLPLIAGNSQYAVSDYSETSYEKIVERVRNAAFDGAIILLHGHNEQTAIATAIICRELYDQSYRFCTLDELFEFKGIKYEDLPTGVMIYGVDPNTNKPITKSVY